MALLRDVRSLFRRRSRPVELDIGDAAPDDTLTPPRDPGSGEDDPRTPSAANMPNMPNLPNRADRADRANRANRAIDKIVETKPARTRITPETARTYEEVLGMVRRIGDHLESQAERTERLLGLMDRLPQALDSLPELNRQNARLLEALHQHFTQAKGREETLNSTLSTMNEASGRQTEVLGLIQQQVEASSQTAGQLTETLGGMRGALSDLADSNTRSTDVFAEMAEATSRRETELAEALLRTQRWIIGAVLCCGTASIAAIAIAAFALMR